LWYCLALTQSSICFTFRGKVHMIENTVHNCVPAACARVAGQHAKKAGFKVEAPHSSQQLCKRCGEVMLLQSQSALH
jgi:hypothetical protein